MTASSPPGPGADLRSGRFQTVPLGPPGEDGRLHRLIGYIARADRRALYAENEDLILKWTLEVPFASTGDDRGNRSAILGVLAYARSKRLPLTADVVLTAKVIDGFGATLNPASAGSMVWRLNRVAEAVHGVPLPSAGRRRFPRKAKSPYTHRQRAAFYEAADVLTNNESPYATDVNMMLDLTFGAGCSSKSLGQLRVMHLKGRANQPGFLNDPERDVPIPLSPELMARLRNGVKHLADDDFMFRPTIKARGAVVMRFMTLLRKQPSALDGFFVPRAQKSWRLDVLDKFGFAHVAALVGARKGNRAITDLTVYLTLPDAARTAALNRMLTQ